MYGLALPPQLIESGYGLVEPPPLAEQVDRGRQHAAEVKYPELRPDEARRRYEASAIGTRAQSQAWPVLLALGAGLLLLVTMGRNRKR